jgi:dienelactone hydrolase
MKIKDLLFAALLVAALVLGACGGNAALPTEAASVASTELPTEPPHPTSAIVPTETATLIPLKPDSTRVEFQSADGTPLVGYYYPAAVADAPVVVLMHWAGGNQTDWNKVGLVEWLRNWSQPAAGSAKRAAPLAGIYVPMPQGLSFAVFTFDYRGYGESGKGGPRESFIADSVVALEQAGKMEGVDPSKVSAIGSSIGADGAADSCARFPCVGVLSLSPGSYLGFPYNEAVGLLGESGIPAWCVASEGDYESFPTCNGASGDNFKSITYPGSAHGTAFLMDGEAPQDIGQVLLDWLTLVYEID